MFFISPRNIFIENSVTGGIRGVDITYPRICTSRSTYTTKYQKGLVTHPVTLETSRVAAATRPSPGATDPPGKQSLPYPQGRAQYPSKTAVHDGWISATRTTRPPLVYPAVDARASYSTRETGSDYVFLALTL